jgi:hypothetical protein
MNQKLEKHFRKMLTKQTASPLIDAEYQAELYGQWALEHGVKQITIYSEAKIDWSRYRSPTRNMDKAATSLYHIAIANNILIKTISLQAGGE